MNEVMLALKIARRPGAITDQEVNYHSALDKGQGHKASRFPVYWELTMWMFPGMKGTGFS